MKRITVPEPQIDLYNDGFEDHDLLGRAETGKKLSDLVERIDEPLVIALDGAWGSGKSHFLKCWVGEHLKRDGNTTLTVYFDAFKHDFLDDPLIALTGEILSREEKSVEPLPKRVLEKIRTAAPQLKRGVIRAGIGLATAGIVSNGDDLVDGAAKAIGKDLTKATDDFWKKEDGKRAAMAQFREALIELTEPEEDGTPTRKLVIVIDELDRCRPDYALSLLEIIKHFFNVPGVHFVLGVNLNELQNSVRARYGARVSAERYLRKFFSLQMSLKLSSKRSGARDLIAAYFDECLRSLQITDNQAIRVVRFIIQHQRRIQISLRDVEQITSQLALMEAVDEQYCSVSYSTAIAALCVLRVTAPSSFNRIENGEITVEEVCTSLGLPANAESCETHQQKVLFYTLAASMGEELDTSERYLPQGDEAETDDKRKILELLARRHFSEWNLDLGS